MKISVLGCGRWGSFISWYLSSQNFEVLNWGLEDTESYKILKETGANEYVKLNKNIKLSSDLNEAVDFADVIIIAIKAQALRSLLLSM